MKSVVLGVAITCVLSACGGGGGGGGNSNNGQVTPPATAPFSKYVGEWKDACQFHHRETVILATTGAATTATLSDKIEYFDNADCSGTIVATGVYSQPIATLQYVSTVPNATVHLQSGVSLTGAVDRGNGTGSDATVSFTGSGVTSSVVNGKTVWHIAYSGGATDIQINSVSGATPGGLLLDNGLLYILTAVAGSTTTFDASAALTH